MWCFIDSLLILTVIPAERAEARESRNPGIEVGAGFKSAPTGFPLARE